MSAPTLHITATSWGSGSDPFSLLTVRVGKDPRLVIFLGDAYWQWSATALRNRDAGCSWAQALHDALEGWHSTVLHQGETVAILPRHPDYERVRSLVEDVDEGRALPRLLTGCSHE